MSASTVSVVGVLVHEYRDLQPLLAEHLEDNEGEVLPHLFLADVMRWLAGRVAFDPDICRSVLRWLERQYRDGDEGVKGLIMVSGIEMIPDPGLPGSTLREMLGPTLQKIDPWLT